MQYLSIRQVAEKWEISKLRVQTLCPEGRISGVIRVDSHWVIPADAEKSKDARVKLGNYIKHIEQ